MLVGLSSHISGGKDTVTRMIQLLMLYHQPPIAQKSMVKSWANSKTDIETVKEWMKPLYEDKFVKLSTWENRKFAGKLKQIVSLLTGISVADLEKESVKSSEFDDEWSWWYFMKTQKPVGIDKEIETMVPFDTTDLEMFKRRYTHLGADKMYQKPLTVRTLLQKLGTDAMRDKVHPNIHVNALFADYLPIGSEQYYTGVEDSGVEEVAYEPVWPNWIISDLRFPNELKAIKDRGGICIRINRGKEYWNDPEWLTGKKSYSQPISLHPSETALDDAGFDYTIQNSGTLEELLEQVRTMLLHFKIIT